MIDIMSEPNMWILFLCLPFKMWASWEAAQKHQVGWFVCFFLVHLYAIPEIVYLIWGRKSRAEW
jgi:hypothetical protein